jgi:hypothetical protein
MGALVISRRSTIAIAEAYDACFTDYSAAGKRAISTILMDPLYDFLYANNFNAWLLNAFRLLSRHYSRALKNFIMQLHTGESVVAGTATWTWEQRRALGQTILKDLAECLIRERLTSLSFELSGHTRRNAVDAMQRALELDGCIYREDMLWVPEETVIEEGEEQDLLAGLFASVALPDPTTLKHHLDLSATNYQGSRWDDSIANSRKVLEGVLQQVAARHSQVVALRPLAPEELAKPVAVRDYLETSGLLEKREKTTIAEVYGLLSHTGGHPYIAEKDQARLMRHLALTFCQFVLLRLQGSLGGARP